MDNVQSSSSSSSFSLCKICRDLFSGSWLQPWDPEGASRETSAVYYHHPDLISLQAYASRREDCPLCVVLFDRLRFAGKLERLHKNPKNVYSETRVKCFIAWGPTTIRQRIQPGVETPCIELHFSLESSTDELNLGCRGVHLVDLDLWPAQLVRPHLSQINRADLNYTDSTFSPKTFEFIRQKLALCGATHKRCLARQPSGSSQPYVPLRLVDVGTTWDLVVKVVEGSFSESEAGRVRYITLSHSWGKAQIVTLSHDFAELLKNGISLELLPRTFRDAITVTRQLEIRYIWIDSLCIFQDSKEDWSAQAPQMQNIYKYAFLNISASLGSDSHSGLFRYRIPEAIWPFHVEATWDDGGIGFARNRSETSQGPRPGSYYCLNPYLWREEVDQSLLSLRAWVMQERILSPRACYFGSSQVYWQCHENEASEIFPSLEPEWSSPSNSVLYKFVATPNPMSLRRTLDEVTRQDDGREMDHDQRAGLYREWNKFIEAYSTCRLTVDGDVFMALEGIAREVRDCTGDELVMGLWRSQLPAALCWYVEWDSVAMNPSDISHQFHPIRPREWRAPTWSWAAMRLPVCYEATRSNVGELQSLLEVVALDSIEVRPGCFEPRWLRVRGRLYSGSLLPRVDEEVVSGRFRQKGKTIVWLRLNPKIHARTLVCLDDSETLVPGSMGHPILLPVCKYRCMLSETEKGYQVEGLLLGRSGLKRGLYYRRGTYHMRDYHDVDVDLRDVVPGPWVEYESRCETTNLCTISII